MILLRQNTNNSVSVTLSEKTSINTDTYLLQFTNDLSKEVFSLIVTDVSPSKLRYNSFNIPVTSSANPFSGSVNLTLPGYYNYTFFEIDGDFSNEFNDDFGGSFTTASLALNSVERGKMLLINPVSQSVQMFTSSYNPAPVFNPEDYQ